MKRDIIKADIEWDENANDPYINLDVKIDDEDFVRNIYIKDIKLYNQNTFVNPTNPNDGVSIFSDEYEGEKEIKFTFKKVLNKNINFFVVDEIRPETDGQEETSESEEEVNSNYKPETEEELEGHYKLVDGEYKQLTVEDLNSQDYDELTTYHFENNIYYYFNEDDDDYDIADVTHIKDNFFYIEDEHVNRYYYENLQDDPLFTQNFDINNDIIIISVKIHPNPDDKCESDYILKAIYNKKLLLLESMAGVREIADTCTIPRRFIDFILRQKAIDLAQENNDIDLLCKYFKMFSGSIGTNKIEFAPCGCLRG